MKNRSFLAKAMETNYENLDCFGKQTFCFEGNLVFDGLLVPRIQYEEVSCMLLYSC